MMNEKMENSVRDAAIIASAQKIEHYEISGYGTARAYAMQLGLSEVEDLLTATLNEEYEADDSLTALAFFDVNLPSRIWRSA
jgi:ferritin-like metal-binding protein YciE